MIVALAAAFLVTVYFGLPAGRFRRQEDFLAPLRQRCCQEGQ
jgi:hypothetical protein